MNNLEMSKKSWILLIGVILIIVAGLCLYFLNSKWNNKKVLEVQTTQLGKADIPDGLPKNLPVEVGSKVMQNYESTTNDGRKQSTRQITSKKEPKAALDEYIEFYQKLGYIGGYSEAASQADGQQLAQMKKNQDLLTIVATPNADKSTTVEFTLIQAIQTK